MGFTSTRRGRGTHCYLAYNLLPIILFVITEPLQPTAAETSLPWKRPSQVELSNRARDESRDADGAGEEEVVEGEGQTRGSVNPKSRVKYSQN